MERKGKVYEIPALPAADSFRITCPVVANSIEDLGRELFGLFGLGEDETGSGGPDEPGPEMAGERSSRVAVEEVTPTKDDQRALARAAEPKWKTRKRLRNSPRKAVERLLKEVDHTICGPPCREEPVPQEVLALNQEFTDLFPAKVPGGLPPSRQTDHRIDLKPDSRIPTQRMYRMAPAEGNELPKQLKTLQDLGFIEPSTSPYGAGVLFVPKANGKLRLCVDYRHLNAITVTDVYPLPRIDELIDAAWKSKCFSKLDLHSGFHQIRIHPGHVERTAFKTKYGTFQFRVMPFGLCNAPATFQRTMDFLIQELREFCRAFVDDILVNSDTKEEQVEMLRELYKMLRKEKVFANLEKCSFAQPEVEYCGFILGKYGIRPQPRKLMAIHLWPTLKNAVDVKIFLGLGVFYQRFVPDYATIAAPLTDLMKKKWEWRWGEAEEGAFQELKIRLLKYPVLTVPDFKKPMVLHTDASDVGLGAKLSQRVEDGNLRLVACRSRKLSQAEKNYPVHEKEMLA